MFDEYVQHTTGHNVGLVNAPSPSLQYEGFEPSSYEPDDTRAGNLPTSHIVEPTPSRPLFDLARVQYTLPAPLVSLVVSSNTLIMGLSDNRLVLLELARAEQLSIIQIPRKPSDMSIYKMFFDPSGRHLLVTSTQGETWYIYIPSKKPKQLKSFKIIIESIAWSKSALLSSQSTSTREMLIGARNGVIYEAMLDGAEDLFKSQDRYLQPLFSLPEKHPITGIRFDMFPPLDPRKALVVVTTPTRIYQFVGAPDRRSDDGGRVFSSLFASYRDVTPKILELPGQIQRSELRIFSPKADQAHALPRNIAWMTAAGIYHGTLNFESTSDELIDAAQLLPYPSFSLEDAPASTEAPLSIALTNFHFLLLYKDRLVGVCNLNEKMTYEEFIPMAPNEQVKGLSVDPVRGTYWVYTDQSIFELSNDNETSDVWKIYLEKGQYEAALEYTKTAAQRDMALSAQAQAFFSDGKYFQAAQSFSQCSVTFEEVALKFLDAGERDALRSYLFSRLERTQKTDLTQRMILATWLAEFYLSKCNELDDLIASQSVSQDVGNFEAERTTLEDDLKQFFVTYKANLDRTTIYELVQGHGRTDLYLYFASVIGDFERVVEHWVLEEDWSRAIDVLNRQSDLELYYRFGPVLMRNTSKETVDSWLRRSNLDPLRLVPSLLQLQHVPRDPLSPNQAIRYLNHVVFEQGNTSSTLHNLLITFYASPSSPSRTAHLLPTPEDDAQLLRFLSTAPADPLSGKPYYDLDYALRLCKQTGRIQPCVHIYSKMGLWENSVDLALEKGDLELAKINADRPEDDIPLRKKLWLKIAKYVVQEKQDIKTAMRFLENTELLKIEDILPFFPDFVVIDDFKEEICNALESYSVHIDELKGEMDEATRNAQAIKDDIVALKNRFVTIDAGERCSSCGHALLTRQFYVFPCQHTFHADCLIGLAKEYLPSHLLRRILALQTELVQSARVPFDGSSVATPAVGVPMPVRQRTLLSSNFGNPLPNGIRAANALGRNVLSAGDKLRDLIVPDTLVSLVTAPAGWIPGMGPRKAGPDLDMEKKAEKLRTELENVLASNCPLCESVIVGLDKPFIRDGEMDTSWDL